VVRRLLALLVSLPLMAAGAVSAHWLAYQLAVPEASARATLLAATGHARATWQVGAVAALAAVALVTLFGLIAGRGSMLDRVKLRPGLFVALPACAFVVQEQLERYLVGYGAPWHVWQEPTFWRGLVLQVPFGIVAFLVATLLLRGARAVRRLVERRRRKPRVVVAGAGWVVSAVSASPVLVRRVRGGDALCFRGPPAGLHACL
jgi:hypothetical protein